MRILSKLREMLDTNRIIMKIKIEHQQNNTMEAKHPYL